MFMLIFKDFFKDYYSVTLEPDVSLSSVHILPLKYGKTFLFLFLPLIFWNLIPVSEYLSVYLSVSLSVYLPVYLYIYLSSYLSLCLSFCLPVCCLPEPCLNLSTITGSSSPLLFSLLFLTLSYPNLKKKKSTTPDLWACRQVVSPLCWAPRGCCEGQRGRLSAPGAANADPLCAHLSGFFCGNRCCVSLKPGELCWFVILICDLCLIIKWRSATRSLWLSQTPQPSAHRLRCLHLKDVRTEAIWKRFSVTAEEGHQTERRFRSRSRLKLLVCQQVTMSPLISASSLSVSARHDITSSSEAGAESRSVCWDKGELTPWKKAVNIYGLGGIPVSLIIWWIINNQ